MGVRHLDTYIRNNVENGCFTVKIENEIREYYSKAKASSNESSTSPPPPVIVIDVFALAFEFLSVDRSSLYFGARFNVGFWVIDHFLRKLKSFGVTLEFFVDGSVLDFKLETWCERRDNEYRRMIEAFDAVDKGTDVATIRSTLGLSPGCTYGFQHLAKTHGKLTVSVEKECDQELAAFACRVNALAVISNDSDFLIFAGDWKYWSSKELDLNTMETIEYNRQALVDHLGLTFEQMPLFATLCGNDIVKLEELKRFHYSLGQYFHKITNVANFVQQRAASVDYHDVLERAFGSRYHHVEGRFHQSLDFYRTDYETVPKPKSDPIEDILHEHHNHFVYEVWNKLPHAVALGVVDLRSTELGQQLPLLGLRIMSRTAGIVIFHHRKRRKFCAQPFIIKLDHESNCAQQNFHVQIPDSPEPPPLTDLFSLDPVVMEELEPRKLQLLSWIVSDRLDHQQLKSIRRAVLPTVVTLYHMMENHVLQLFEADLLLQVAYDVMANEYDPFSMEIPDKVESRPFRVAFFYRNMYEFVVEAMESIGLNLKGYRKDPPFDGVLFHTKYSEWAELKGDTEKIAQWRIYAE